VSDADLIRSSRTVEVYVMNADGIGQRRLTRPDT
jgi:hypothetical protein